MDKKQLRQLKDKYKWQKWYSSTRKDRNGDPIGWEFTFDSWLEVWLQSGKLDQRGTHEGGYVMARKGDIGPYSPDNVDIILHSENISYKATYWRMSDEQKAHLSQLYKGKNRYPNGRPKLTCPHCNLTGGDAQMKRWHFNNCKQKI